MALKREIKDAYIEGGNSVYIKTHSNAVFVNENETETLTQRLDNLKGKIDDNTTQLNKSVDEISNIKTNYAKKTDVNDLASNKAEKTEVNDLASNKAEKTELQATNVELETQKARIDSFVSLPTGSTTGDAELIDARIAVGGKTYDNLGNAIRGQIKNLKDSFENEFEAYKNLLKLNNGVYTKNGVTVTIYDNEILLNGTATSATNITISESREFLESNTRYQCSIQNTSGSLTADSKGKAFASYVNYESSNDQLFGYDKGDTVNLLTKTADNGWSSLQYINLYIFKGVSFNDYKICLQVEKGDTVTNFIPYCTKHKNTPYFLNDGKEPLNEKAISDYLIGERKIQRTFRHLLGTTYSDGRKKCPFNFNTVNKKLEYKNTSATVVFHSFGSHYYSANTVINGADFPTSTGSYEVILNNNDKALYIKPINSVNEFSDIVLGILYYDADKNSINTVLSESRYSFSIDNIPMEEKYIGLKVNCLGDSLTYGYLPPEFDSTKRMKHPYPELLKKELGLDECRNYGITGTCVSNHKGYDTNTENRSFSYRYDKMNDDADLIIVMGGTNDYLKYFTATSSTASDSKVEIGDINSTDELTFCGGYNKLIKGLLDKYNGKRIILCVPPQNYRTWETNGLGNNFGDYREAIIKLGIKYSLPVFDAFSELGLNQYNCRKQDSEGNYIYTYDGIHMQQNVVKDMFVPLLADFIRKLYS